MGLSTKLNHVGWPLLHVQVPVNEIEIEGPCSFCWLNHRLSPDILDLCWWYWVIRDEAWSQETAFCCELQAGSELSGGCAEMGVGLFFHSVSYHPLSVFHWDTSLKPGQLSHANQSLISVSLIHTYITTPMMYTTVPHLHTHTHAHTHTQRGGGWGMQACIDTNSWRESSQL